MSQYLTKVIFKVMESFVATTSEGVEHQYITFKRLAHSQPILASNFSRDKYIFRIKEKCCSTTITDQKNSGANE